MVARSGHPSVVLAVLALVALTSCGDTTGPAVATTTTEPAPTTTQPAPEPVGGLVAEIGTNRLYAVNRAFGLVLRNTTDEPIVVRELQLDSRLFATLPPTVDEIALPAGGRRLVVPLPYGEVRCDDESGPTFPVRVVVDGGEELHLDAPEEYEGAIARLHQRECAAADVRERVDITWGDEWVQDGITVSGELRLDQRHRGEPVAIDDAVGNVIFTLVLDEAHPVMEVSDDAPSASVPVVISADRCDPHAVAEFKTPFLFLSWVAVGDGEPVPVPLQLTGDARTALEQLIATCST
jgi:hypothetical protein